FFSGSPKNEAGPVIDNTAPTFTWAEACPVAPAIQSAIAAATVFAYAGMTVPSRPALGRVRRQTTMVSQGGGSRLHAALLELSMLLSPTAVHLGDSNADCASRRRVVTQWRFRPSVRSPQPVADAGLRQNIVRALGIGFDLLPELPDIDAQVLCVGEVVPQFAEQEFVGEHFAGMLHQHAQKLVLLGGELHLLLAHLHDTP